MRFAIYRSHDGFVVSADCMQPPLAVQRAKPLVSDCGSVDLPEKVLLRASTNVLNEGFAFVGQSDPEFPLFTELCTVAATEPSLLRTG